MRTIGIRDALREALHEEMARDDSVFVMGEDVIAHGGPYTVTQGIAEKWPDRIFETPIAEAGIVGFGSGRSARRHASGSRDHVPRLHHLRHGRSGEPGGEDALHDGRPGQRAHGDPPPLRPGPAARRPALADHGVLVHARAGVAGGGPHHSLRCQGVDEDRDPQPRPGGVLRVQGACT